MKSFKIMTLGASGAGKTVFLASMFKALSIQKNSSFKLDVEDQQQRKILNSIYAQILTGDSWPPGTKDVSEWTFICQVQTEDLNKYTACKFTYFDYAGGRLTDGDKDPDFEKVVQQADAILGLLDGQKIYAWLTGTDEQKDNIFLTKDLPSILNRMENTTVPVHFVISKWDILDQKFSLSQVREKLLTIPAFEKLLSTRQQVNSIVRIVPVSSVGLEFATMQADGSMKKNPSKIPIPFLVEVPMSCVLPDKLQQEFNQKQAKQKQLEKQIQKTEDNNILVSVLVGGLDILGVGLDGVGMLLALEGSSDSSTIRVFSMFNSLLKQGIVNVNQKLSLSTRKKRENTLKNVKNEQSALMHALNIFYDFEKELLERFPESKLI